MKSRLYLLILTAALFLCACHGKQLEPTVYDSPAETAYATTETVPATTETVPMTTEAEKPLHSELYLPDCSVEQLLTYFKEVVLHAEYSHGDGDASLVQKWLTPISFWIYGDPTEEDLSVLNDLFAQFNQIPGFPGFCAAETEGSENLRISFLDRNSFRDQFSGAVNGEDAWGATEFWYYIDNNEIHTARIGYRTDIDQSVRNSILVEEIVNMLGIADTELREDSVVYQHSDENLVLSDVDWVILNLLYDPAVHCGMDAEHCADIIRNLYY